MELTGRFPHQRWLVFGVAGLAGVVMYFHFPAGATLSQYLTAEWGLSAGQLGLLSALSFLSYGLVQIPTGYLCDTVGPHKAMTAGLVVLAFSTALFAGAPCFAVASLSRALLGLGQGMIWVPAFQMLSRWFRSTVFATIQGGLALLSSIGYFLGTLPLASAAGHWGWRFSLLVVAGLTILAAIAAFCLDRINLGQARAPRVCTLQPRTLERPACALGTFREALKTWWDLPTLRIASALLFAALGSLGSLQNLWVAPLLRQVRGVSVLEASRVLLVFLPGLAVGPVLFGFVSDRIVRARRPVLVSALLAQAAVSVLVVATFEWLPLPFLYISFGVLSFVGRGVLITQAMVKELCPPGLLGTVFAIVNSSSFCGTAVLQIVTGSLLNVIGPASVSAEPIYSPGAYMLALSPTAVFVVIAAVLSFWVGETFGSSPDPVAQ